MNKLLAGPSSVRKVLLAAWLVAVGLGAATASMAAISTFFGEDLGIGELTPLPSHPNSDAARNAFFAQLTNIGTENLESFANGTGAPLAITFPGANPPLVATLLGNGNIVSVTPGTTNGFGRYAISGSNFWENSDLFSIDFSRPIAAFGFYGVDVGDFNGQLTLTLTDGTVTNITIPSVVGAPGGSIIYFGIIDPDHQYVSASFGNTAAGTDFFAFDDFSVGGKEVLGGITLSPDTATNCVGLPHTLTAGVKVNNVAQGGKVVTFNVFSGPNIGVTGSAVTDSAGSASFTYVGSGGVGIDSIRACAQIDSNQVVCAEATKTWIECNRPPDCSAAVACEAVLWPPNHKYHNVEICGVTDPDGDPVTITVTSITQDEPVNTRGDGNTCPDAQIVDGQGSVRAERTGTPGIPGNGRVYAINFVASDGKVNGTCRGTVYVCVPHDMSDPTCVDDGQRYNSLGSCTGASLLHAESVSLKVGEVTSSQAQLNFALPSDTPVDLSVFDVAGRKVATVEHSTLSSGVYDRTWNMAGVARGFYFVRLQAGAVNITKSVIKLR
jgi:hypothetical protein